MAVWPRSARPRLGVVRFSVILSPRFGGENGAHFSERRERALFQRAFSRARFIILGKIAFRKSRMRFMQTIIHTSIARHCQGENYGATLPLSLSIVCLRFSETLSTKLFYNAALNLVAVVIDYWDKPPNR